MRIVRVLAPNADVYTLEGTNTWVLGHDPAIVIDPGPDEAGHLHDVAGAAGRVEAIVLTHGHDDHAAGAASLARVTGASLHAYRPPEGGHRLRDGQQLAVRNIALTVVHTPGHTPDHVALFLADERVLFTGDAVLGRGTSLIDPPEGDLEAYLRSLARMREMGARTIYPGHGPAVLNAPAKLDEYLQHRADREEQVLAGLRDGLSTIDQLVARIYAEYPADVRPLAARSVLAHLLKLEAEGRADHRGKAAEAKYRLSTPRACARCGRPVRGKTKLCDRCQLAALQERPADQERPTGGWT